MSTPPEPPEPWLDDLVEGVVLIHDGRIRAVNRAAAHLLGADPSWSLGRPPIAVLRDHRLERVWLEGRPDELTVRGRRLQAAPITGGLALRDVTDAREARDDARELLAVLSHELRTPLTTVQSSLEALGYEDLPGETRTRLLARALEETERLGRLVADLTADATPPRERSVELEAVLDRARAVLAPVLSSRGVRIVRHLERATVWADPDKVLQVLINLIENAAIHGPRDVEVEVASAEEGGWARLVVRDVGRPLPPDAFARLFAPRAQAAPGEGPRRGLGLYVVRTIAERWGGRAWGVPWREETGDGVRSGNEFGVLVPLTRDRAPARGVA